MREEATRFGTRVYYSGGDVPDVIDEAGEMFWEPFRHWRATLRLSRRTRDPRYSLALLVEWRPVFVGEDDDVVRLLALFQAFLDEHADHVDRPGFRCQRQTPERR